MRISHCAFAVVRNRKAADKIGGFDYKIRLFILLKLYTLFEFMHTLWLHFELTLRFRPTLSADVYNLRAAVGG